MARKRKPAARRLRSSDRRLGQAHDQVDALIDDGRWAEACGLINELLRTYPRDEFLLRSLAEAAFRLDDAHTFQFACEEVYRLCPRDRHLPYLLTVAYLRNGWPALALSMARHALAHDPNNPRAEETRGLLTQLEPLVREQIQAFELDGPDGLECLTLHDRIRSLLAQGRYAESRAAAEELAERRPRFPAAYNNGAEAAYHEGRLARAIDLEERLLAFQPDNFFALANLTRFLHVSGRAEEARRHADRLRALPAPSKDLAVKQAEALVWLGDDAGVLAVCEQALRLDTAEEPQEDAQLHHLAAVAADRLGREDEARRHWQAALRHIPHFVPARDNLDDLARPAGERNAPWYYGMPHFVPRSLIDELLARVTAVRGRDEDEAVRREAHRYLAEHPELEGLVPLLLDRSDGPARELALHLVRLLRTPAVLEAARDFALGQRGPDRLRVQAAELAGNAGLLPAGGPTRLWLKGEWRAGALQRCEIHSDPVEYPHPPAVRALLDQGMAALRDGEPIRAARALRQALELDPDNPVVMNNLAAACAQGGREDEGEALALRLHERHPDYLFGRTALANLATARGELERARQLLEPLLTRPRLHVIEFAALCAAQVNLQLAEGNEEQARQLLEMWRQVTPGHPSLAGYERRLRRT